MSAVQLVVSMRDTIPVLPVLSLRPRSGRRGPRQSMRPRLGISSNLGIEHLVSVHLMISHHVTLHGDPCMTPHPTLTRCESQQPMEGTPMIMRMRTAGPLPIAPRPQAPPHPTCGALQYGIVPFNPVIVVVLAICHIMIMSASLSTSCLQPKASIQEFYLSSIKRPVC